jgi:hypothetical protein
MGNRSSNRSGKLVMRTRGDVPRLSSPNETGALGGDAGHSAEIVWRVVTIFFSSVHAPGLIPRITDL